MLWRGDDGSLIYLDVLFIEDLGIDPIFVNFTKWPGPVVTYRPEPLRLPPPRSDERPGFW